MLCPYSHAIIQIEYIYGESIKPPFRVNSMKNFLRNLALFAVMALFSISLPAMEQPKSLQPKSLTEASVDATVKLVLNGSKTLAELQSTLPRELYDKIYARAKPGITAKLVSLIQSSSTLDEAVEKIKKASNESINNDTEIAGELIKALADKYKMEFNLAAQQVVRADLSQEDQKDLAKEISWGDEDYLVFVVSRLKTPGALQWLKEYFVKNPTKSQEVSLIDNPMKETASEIGLPTTSYNKLVKIKLLGLIKSSSTLAEAVEKIKKASDESINNNKEIAGALLQELARWKKFELNKAAAQVPHSKLSSQQVMMYNFDDAYYLIFMESQLNTPGAKAWLKEYLDKNRPKGMKPFEQSP